LESRLNLAKGDGLSRRCRISVFVTAPLAEWSKKQGILFDVPKRMVMEA